MVAMPYVQDRLAFSVLPWRAESCAVWTLICSERESPRGSKNPESARPLSRADARDRSGLRLGCFSTACAFVNRPTCWEQLNISISDTSGPEVGGGWKFLDCGTSGLLMFVQSSICIGRVSAILAVAFAGSLPYRLQRVEFAPNRFLENPFALLRVGTRQQALQGRHLSFCLGSPHGVLLGCKVEVATSKIEHAYTLTR